MNPAIFISVSVLLGVLFGLQEWFSLRHLGYPVNATIFLESWGFQFFLWGTISWLLWRLLGTQIQQAGLVAILALFLPLSILVGAAEEMIWVLAFPSLPMNYPGLPYWHRLSIYLYEQLLNNIVVFWCMFFLFRGIGYYRRFREHERATAQLEIQLANARISALRMQLNPHFLFNALNTISSQVERDPRLARGMIEHLGDLLRLSLESKDKQEVPLAEELEFLEHYLAIQKIRFGDNLKVDLAIAPEVRHASVPSLFLQPLVENAIRHGLSQRSSRGTVAISAERLYSRIRIRVSDDGAGLPPNWNLETSTGLGLAATQQRIAGLYPNGSSQFAIRNRESGGTEVEIELPFRVANGDNNGGDEA